jgi:hypothetical protein
MVTDTSTPEKSVTVVPVVHPVVASDLALRRVPNKTVMKPSQHGMLRPRCCQLRQDIDLDRFFSQS